PEMVAFEADPAILGTPFYLMRRVEGVVHGDAALTSLPRARRRPLYLAHAALMAALHAVDPFAIGLGELSRPGSFLDRQVRRWCDVLAEHRPGPVAEIRTFLDDHRPADEALALVHGDVKFNNVIVDAAGERILALLDWEL